MQDQMEKFAEAHRVLTAKFVTDAAQFNREIVGYPIPAQPELMSDDRAAFRADFMQEELDEFREAQKAGDLEGAVDAIIDLMYVAAGAMNEMGVTIQPCWDEVHNANMRKKRGAIAKRSESKGFDAVKPDGWQAPSHALYLTITSEEVAKILALRKAQEVTSEMTVPFEGLDLCKGNGEKIIVMGYARHGKDTVCELLASKYGFKFTSSSLFCAERVILSEANLLLGATKPPYKDAQACYDDRSNHRELWYQLITAYNTPDKSRLGREIFEENDVYCGIRNAREFHALKNAGLFDWAIWVDASERLPIESKDSCTIEPWMADFVLDNNGSLEDLERSLKVLMHGIFGHEAVGE